MEPKLYTEVEVEERLAEQQRENDEHTEFLAMDEAQGEREKSPEEQKQEEALRMRKAILADHAQNYRAMEISFELEIEALKAQPFVPSKVRQQGLKDLTEKRKNAAASAARMEELLASLG